MITKLAEGQKCPIHSAKGLWGLKVYFQGKLLRENI